MDSTEVRLGNEKEDWKESLGEVRVSSEPCKPTTSACARPAHFVRRRKKKEPRSAVVPVRLTDAERSALKRFAEARRLSLSDFIRTMVLGRKLPHPAPPPISLATYQELGRIGNNLNQLLRAANSGRVLKVDQTLLTRLQDELRLLGHCLLHGRA